MPLRYWALIIGLGAVWGCSFLFNAILIREISPLWVSAGVGWTGDVTVCPRCGRSLSINQAQWACACGLARPIPTWTATDGAAISGYTRIPVHLRLPGRFNLGNAVMAMAAASVLGVEPGSAAMAMGMPISA